MQEGNNNHSLRLASISMDNELWNSDDSHFSATGSVNKKTYIIGNTETLTKLPFIQHKDEIEGLYPSFPKINSCLR